MAKAKKVKTKPAFEAGQVVRWYESDGRYQTDISIVKIVNINPLNSVCLVEKLENGFWHLASMDDLFGLPTGVKL